MKFFCKGFGALGDFIPFGGIEARRKEFKVEDLVIELRAYRKEFLNAPGIFSGVSPVI